MRRAAACALLAAWSALTSFPGPAAAHDEAAVRAQLEQRIALNAKLLADSPTATRITTSGHVQAIAHFEEGRVHQALAEDLLAKGDLGGARRAVDTALHHVGMARRLVPDQQARLVQARQRYETKSADLARLIDAWQRHAGAGSPGAGQDGDLVAAIGLVDTAKFFAGQGRWDDAGFTLGTAESHVLAGMNRLLAARTLDYTVRPGSPAEEFQLELSRHQGMTDLVPLALAELKPRGDALALIERYGKTSAALRGEAVARFSAGDTPRALADIRNAILFLQRALAAAGVSAPDPTGSPP